MAKIGVIGAGSWGIALAWLLMNNGHDVTVWSVIESEIEMLKANHEHKDKLPGVKLQDDMQFTTDLEGTCKDKDLLQRAIPLPHPAHRETADSEGNHPRRLRA